MYDNPTHTLYIEMRVWFKVKNEEKSLAMLKKFSEKLGSKVISWNRPKRDPSRQLFVASGDIAVPSVDEGHAMMTFLDIASKVVRSFSGSPPIRIGDYEWQMDIHANEGQVRIQAVSFLTAFAWARRDRV